ncbi:Cold shock protein, CspA family [Altererythrobacter xiamenensis]|uniref:Cold shock protein, CspA family n=1 Tax=Altererythrobacter xiamenensis TaxID=1316679 RepID=A0A1Y6FB45_9SPHN|nr:cold shock domain-containing protein [Altererythrobacter xiamenensis]SMQ69643.1 Cold shock protein, CspA family [Altererythrobacter xiamenensis]
MANFGHIKHYNANTGTGFIRPEDGEDPLPFRASEMIVEGEDPKEEIRVRYEIEKDRQGEPQAVRLQKA